MTAGAGANGTLAVVDLNADLGESYGAWRLGDDAALLDVVTSANVACGFHAGDPVTIRRTCALAVARGVRIGAQVSYQDLAGFGRREMAVPPEELEAEVLYQLAALDGIARAEGGRAWLRQAARRALQPRRLGRRAGGRRRRGRAQLRQPAAGAHAARLGARRGGGGGGDRRRYRRRSPTGPTTTTARWSSAACRARC